MTDTCLDRVGDDADRRREGRLVVEQSSSKLISVSSATMPISGRAA
jgi:hypothetical protein